MKVSKFIVLFLILAFTMTMLPGCYGSFSLVRKVHRWNGSVGSKFVNTIVYWVLMVIPVYGVCVFIDFWVLNTIEFWIGSNPMALENPETETRVVQKDGKEYEVTVGNSRIHILQTEGPDVGKEVTMVYDSELKSWYIQDDNQEQKAVEFTDDFNMVKLINPDGTVDEFKNTVY